MKMVYSSTRQHYVTQSGVSILRYSRLSKGCYQKIPRGGYAGPQLDMEVPGV